MKSAICSSLFLRNQSCISVVARTPASRGILQNAPERRRATRPPSTYSRRLPEGIAQDIAGSTKQSA